jgi:hypothetical protein
MAGLLAADFKDPNVFQGFLTNKLLLGTDNMSLILNEKDYDKKLELLTNQAMKVEVAKKFGNTLHEIKTKEGTKYYFGDKSRIQEVDKSPKTSGGGSATEQDKTNALAKKVIAEGGVFPGREGLSMYVDANGKVTVKKVDSAGLALVNMSGYENFTPEQVANLLGATLN